MRRFLLLLGLLLTSPALRAEYAIGPVTWRVYGTLGLANSRSDQADFLRDLSQQRGANSGDWHARTDSMAGVQARARVSDEVEGVLQLISRYHDVHSVTPELEWGFLSYQPNPGLVARAGRLGTDLYPRADSRRVGYANLAVRPSVDVFGGIPLFHIDGLDLAATRPLGEGLVQAKLYAGLADETVPIDGQLWDLNGTFISGLNLDYQRQAWSFRLGYGQLRFKRGFPFEDQLDLLRQTGFPSAIAAADELALAGKQASYHSFGVGFDDGPWQMEGMLARIRYDTATYENSLSGYLLAGYRLGEWTPYAGYSRIRSRSHGLSAGLPDVPPLDQLNALVLQWQNLSHANQYTFTLGVRWDFQPGMALKLQWDGVHGKPDSVYLYKQVKPGWDGRTDVWSLALDFAF